VSTWRLTTITPCPLDGKPVAMAWCSDCPLFRGSITAHHERHGWEILCDGTAFDECALELDERTRFLENTTR
jgi:hypothetical protein